MLDKETKKAIRGQFNTTNSKVQQVLLSLVRNSGGTLLEPSAGAGDLVKLVEEAFVGRSIKAIELDSSIPKKCKTVIDYMNFFDFLKDNDKKYDTIFGNPPFVAWKDVETETKEKASKTKSLYSDKTNLYHLFIDSSIDLLEDEGELIFIVPKEWLYTTSAEPLRNKVLSKGKITHIVDCGEEKLFPDASVPALLIFRFKKTVNIEDTSLLFAANIDDAFKNKYIERTLISKGSRFILATDEMNTWLPKWSTLGEHFEPKVGIVSGLDSAFLYDGSSQIEPEALKEYLTTQGIKQFIDLNDYKDWEAIPKKASEYVYRWKSKLMARKIASFDDSNWWMYGAIRNKDSMLSNKERFYVYGKTRSKLPFFEGKAKLYSGGIIGLFKKESSGIKIKTAIKILNSPTYRIILEGMFITTGDKVSFQPSTLKDLPFPSNEKEALSWLTKYSKQKPASPL